MFRSSQTQWWLLLLTALVVAVLGFVPARRGLAATYTYDARQRVVNAGVLFVGSESDSRGNGGSNPAPYVFRVLDQRPDVKPVGWTFVNPLAPSQVTQTMVNRWGSYKVGDPLLPTMAAYWEVPLRDISAEQLQQLDVLYLHVSYSVTGSGTYAAQFTPADNEKLRRFVDGGGQLFVEYGGAATENNATSLNALFADIQWQTGALPNVGLPFLSSVTFLHPIASQPYLLGLTDFSILGMSSDPANNIYGSLAPGTGDYGALFGTALNRYSSPAPGTDTGSPAVVAGQLGAGQVVASALEIGRQVSLKFGANFGNPNNTFLALASAANLKVLSNAISWIDTHPTENKTSHQNAAGPSAASFAPAWSYPRVGAAALSSMTSTPPPAAAVWGNFIFVTDAVGTLHCFDAYPSESLLGQPDGVGGKLTDDGILDFSLMTGLGPTPYDEVWNASVGVGASAPTVVNYLNGSSYVTDVLVERPDGSVLVFNALSKTAGTAAVLTLTPPTTYPSGNTVNGATSFSGVNAPAPTYYDGRVYAGQPNGDLYVYSLVGGGSAAAGVRIPLNASAAGEYVIASPAVGLMPNGETTNTVIAYVATNQNLYTVLLGARNDALVPYNVNGSQVGYNLNRNAEYNLRSVVVDMGLTALPSLFDAYGNILTGSTANASGGQDPVFTTPVAGNFFTNWDVDFVNSLARNATLTLHEIKATSYADTSDVGTLSAPAMDRQGDYYYTVNDGTNSYLFGVHPDLLQRNVRLKFRFRIPYAGDPSTVSPVGGAQWSNNPVDADNVDYSDQAHSGLNSLLGFKFVGAPVAAAQGNVYAVAQGTEVVNGKNVPTAAVLCFNANQEITADPVLPAPANFDPTQASYLQLDENTGASNALQIGGTTGNANTIAAHYGQVIASAGRVSVYNFGRNTAVPKQIAGNLCEPQPFTAVPSPSQNPPSSTTWMLFHTNMAWYTTFPVNGTVSGLSLAGSTLMLTDSGNGTKAYNTLYKLPANPAAIGIGKVVTVVPNGNAPGTLVSSPLGTKAGGVPLNIGAVAAAPSAGGGAMVVNGTGGLAAFNQQLTLIADNNRIMQVDNDGNAVWSADATTRFQGTGTSKVDFAHPTSLYPVAANDYLVADTGNNRCVRFDHGGNVLWELTRFNDPTGLMAPGQPLTLSQPASVELRKETFHYIDPNTSQSVTGTLYHYLVADSGNERIVEVTDTVDSIGNLLYVDSTGAFVPAGAVGATPLSHILTWVSHTGDKYGRHYRYAGATYLVIPNTISTPTTTTVEIFALVTNTRIAQPVNGQLVSASNDAPGGSIVAFSRPSPQLSFSNPNLPNDLIYVANRFIAGTGGNAQTYPVQSPRFLHVYAPPQAVPATPAAFVYTFLYADANGAFDLSYTGPNGDTSPPMTSYGGFNGLAFTRTNYRNMNVPATGIVNGFGVPVNFNRKGIPFVPTCIQRLNDDNTFTPRYLITQSNGQSELGMLSPVSRIGGEVFEVDVDNTGVSNWVGGFSGGITPPPPAPNGTLSGFTLSRPGGAGPLTQPMFAIRTPQ